MLRMPYWLAAVTCGLLALGARSASRSWFHPSPIFAVVWAMYLGIPTLVLRDLAPAGTANVLIVVATACVALASLIHVEDSARVSRYPLMTTRVPARLTVLAGFAGVFAGVEAQRAAGLGLSSILSFSSFQQAAISVTQSRYAANAAGVSSTPMLAVIALSFTFCGCVVAPFVAVGLSRPKRALATAWPVLGATFYAAASTARAPMLIAFFLTLSSVLVVIAIRAGGAGRVLRIRTVLTMACATAGVAYGFIYIAFSRVGGQSAHYESIIYKKMEVYAAGSIPALNQWLSGSASEQPTFTMQTFGGLFRYILGGRSSGSLAYSDFVTVEPNGSSATNVYTVLRSLIEDFSIPGALVVLIMMSLAAAHGLRRAITTGSIYGAMAAVAFIGFTFFSSTESIFSFTNVCLGLILATLVLRRWCVLAEMPLLDPAPPPLRAVGRRRSRTPATYSHIQNPAVQLSFGSDHRRAREQPSGVVSEF